MKCPVDNETLQVTERSGVEIEYCPRCRGVWLDRGELDKIIDRGARHGSGHVGHPYRAHHRRKKESFLSELFDF